MFEDEPRPIGVTIIEVLLYVQGIINVIGGLVAIVNRSDLSTQVQMGMNDNELALFGFTLLLAGLFYMYVAKDLAKGVPAARWIVSVVATLHVIGAIWGLLALEGSARNDLLAQGVMSAFVLVLLHTDAAERFFRGRTHL